MQVLLSESEIQSGVARLADQLRTDYAGRPLTILAVMTGSLVFLVDLMRLLELPLRIGLIRASSYRGASTSSADLWVEDAPLQGLADRDVLLLDDILDSGRTLCRLRQRVLAEHPRSLRIAVLLLKAGCQQVDLVPDYHCFVIPNRFVVGYGLDFNDDFRHLPHVAAID